MAASKYFGDVVNYYPGVRAKAPLSYQQFVLQQLRGLLGEYFALQADTLRFTTCHFSLVTTPPEKLGFLQRIPHIDSQPQRAGIHSLPVQERIWRNRLSIAIAKPDSKWSTSHAGPGTSPCVEAEKDGANKPAVRYINGDTALYEQVGCQSGVFNRMLVYRRNSLHSGNIPDGFVPDPNPRTGRLSINGFLTWQSCVSGQRRPRIALALAKVVAFLFCRCSMLQPSPERAMSLIRLIRTD